MNIEFNGTVFIKHQPINDCDKCEKAKNLPDETYRNIALSIYIKSFSQT
jgi:hypothetical protein